MPSTSLAQKHLMAGIAHGWHPSHLGHKAPSVAVAKEFSEADKGKQLAQAKKLKSGY